MAQVTHLAATRTPYVHVEAIFLDELHRPAVSASGRSVVSSLLHISENCHPDNNRTRT